MILTLETTIQTFCMLLQFMMMYYHTKSGSNKFYSHKIRSKQSFFCGRDLNPLLWPSPQKYNPPPPFCVCMTFMIMHQHTKFGSKWTSDTEGIILTKTTTNKPGTDRYGREVKRGRQKGWIKCTPSIPTLLRWMGVIMEDMCSERKDIKIHFLLNNYIHVQITKCLRSFYEP